MWIPTPIYARIPQFWLLLGLLFMSAGTYLGFDYWLSFVYYGVGVACCLGSMWIFTMRLSARKPDEQAVADKRAQADADELDDAKPAS